jgi:hypothetical protein
MSRSWENQTSTQRVYRRFGSRKSNESPSHRYPVIRHINQEQIHISVVTRVFHPNKFQSQEGCFGFNSQTTKSAR